MTKPLASLSLDLDNLWSYLKTNGSPGWESFPSYLGALVPRILEVLAERDLRATFFIVGQDAALPQNHAAIRAIADAGHEIANHSFHHEPWLHTRSRDEIRAEIERAEREITAVTGQEPCGFRGPGYSRSPELFDCLAELGYRYDGSSFPTVLAPLARLYFLLKSNLSGDERADRKQLFGRFRDGFRSLRPHAIRTSHGELLEIPVTTMPVFRTPIHLSYVQYLGQFSSRLAILYWRLAMRLCQVLRVTPSVLLHPLDFTSADEYHQLSFFPGMRQPLDRKLELAGRTLDLLTCTFEVTTMGEQARRLSESSGAAAADDLPPVAAPVGDAFSHTPA